MHTTDEPLGSVSRGGVERTPAAVRALGWTSFLTDFSSEAIYPLLPGFVKGLGGTSVEIGLIDGIANAVAAVVRLPSGAVSDAVSPRLALVAGWLARGLALGIQPPRPGVVVRRHRGVVARRLWPARCGLPPLMPATDGLRDREDVPAGAAAGGDVELGVVPHEHELVGPPLEPPLDRAEELDGRLPPADLR